MRPIKNTFYQWCVNNHKEYLLEEWDKEKNRDKNVLSIPAGSSEKVWWKCPNGHSYECKISNRTYLNRGCPYCKNKKVLIGYNDLETTHPLLVKEWDFNKNTLLPSEVSFGSKKKVFWIGKCGHRWEASVNQRAKGSGCPICRKQMLTSFPEQAIFYYVKQAYPDAINGERTILGGLELDIYVPSRKIAIEYDGENWHKNVNRDIEKDKMCVAKKITLIRLRESKCPVLHSTSICISCIHRNLESLNEAMKQLFDYLDYTIDIDVSRDETKIMDEYLVQQKENSIINIKPELLNEWDFDKNDVDPSFVQVGSDHMIWWKCSHGHSWKSTIYNRLKGAGCPVCANQILVKGINDLETLFPNLALEWDYSKNDKKPYEFSAGSTKKVWWKCDKGHSYISSINHRTRRGQGCPVCAGHKVVKGFNDIQTTNPELLKEWDFSKNDLDKIYPHNISKGSNKDVWWKCSKCNLSYKMSVAKKLAGRLCPQCSNFKIKVQNIETGIIYESIKDAALSCNGHPSDIARVCRGFQKTSKGYHWRFVDKKIL